MLSSPISRFALASSVAFLVALGAGCSSPSAGGDTTRPSIIARNPSDSASSVPLDTAVTATFSEEMNQATLAGALTVYPFGSDPTANAVAGTWATTATTVTFTPAQPLKGNQRYGVQVAGSVADLAGNAMEAPQSWSFTTGAPPSFNLWYSAFGPGSLDPTPHNWSNCGPGCARFEQGTVVTLVATANGAGAALDSWGDDCASAPVSGPCTLTMDREKTASATFVHKSFTLTVTTTGAGSGTVSASPAGTSCGSGCWTFAPGTSVTLTANPAADSQFAGFGGDCQGNSCALVMGVDRAVTAQFDLKSYQVQFTKTGNGSVTYDSGAATCANDCTDTLTKSHGSVLTFLATPDLGHRSVWSGACAGQTGDTCTITITAATAVGLSFEPIPYDIALSVGAHGQVAASPAGISCGASCTTYPYGTTVTFTATPDTGYSLAAFSGCTPGAANTCTLVVTGSATVSASFVINTYQVTVTKAGNGSGSVVFLDAGIPCGSGCMSYDYGTVGVRISAAADTGSTFTSWSGCKSVDATTGDCIVDVAGTQAVTATFTLDKHTVTVTRSGAGTGTVSATGINCGTTCSASIDYGTSLTLTGTPGTGSVFAGWTGGGCSGTATPCVVSVTADVTVDARFDKASYNVAVTKSGSGTGTIGFSAAGTSCGTDCQTYDYLTSVTLTATPDSGTAFTGWTGGGCTGTGTCTLSVDAAKAVTAGFNLLRTISVNVRHLAASGLVLRNNGAESLTVNAPGGMASFATQIPDGGNYAVTVLTQPPGGTQQCSVTGTSSGQVSSDVTVVVDCTNLVAATYPAAKMWNEYVKTADPTVACAGTEVGGYSACIHGGERRSVATLDQTSCANLSAADALGAFDWVCDAATNPVTFRSTGLKAGKRLSDLIDWTAKGWRVNSVTVTDASTSTVVFASPSTVWWSNTFAADNFVTPAKGIIKIFTNATRISGSYTGGSGWSFVVKPGVTIDRPFGASTSGSLLTLGGNFIWWEGDITAADGPSTLLEITGSSFAVVRGAKLYVSGAGTNVGTLRVTSVTNGDLSAINTNSSGYSHVGVEIVGGGSNNVHDVVAYGSFTTTAAVEVWSSTGNRIWNVSAQGCSGLSLVGATKNSFSHIMVANAAGAGVTVTGGSDNVFTDLVVAGAQRGIWTYGVNATSDLFGHVTVADTSVAGIELGTPTPTNFTYDKFTFFDVVSANSAGVGLGASAATVPSLTNSRIHNLVSAHNATNVSLARANNDTFSGVLKVGGTGSTNCTVTGGTSPGLADTTCASGATLSTGVGVGASFVGTVTTDDTANPNDVSGVGPTTSWAFQNPYRTWGNYAAGAMFPDAAVRGVCSTASCQIYDWSLYAIDPVMRAMNTEATAGVALTHTWLDATTTTFLSGAIEVMGDGIGNDNGLCESNETCVFAPNIGAYQGHGALVHVGNVTAGSVANVDLWKYPTNGY